MGSNALSGWRREASARLDELEVAHRAVGGAGRGRRVATLQINHAFAVLLSSHFQGFCRNLHTEAVDHVCSQVPPWSADLLRSGLIDGRTLDRGNPSAGNLGKDFLRLGFKLWDIPEIARDPRRRVHLEKLNAWRNAIAHQDFTRSDLLDLGGGRTELRISDVRGWRTSCESLAFGFDDAVADHISSLVGARPW